MNGEGSGVSAMILTGALCCAKNAFKVLAVGGSGGNLLPAPMSLRSLRVRILCDIDETLMLDSSRASSPTAVSALWLYPGDGGSPAVAAGYSTCTQIHNVQHVEQHGRVCRSLQVMRNAVNLSNSLSIRNAV